MICIYSSCFKYLCRIIVLGTNVICFYNRLYINFSYLIFLSNVVMVIFNRSCGLFYWSPFVLWTSQVMLYYFIYITLSAFYFHSKLSIYQSLHILCLFPYHKRAPSTYTQVWMILSSLLTLKTRSHINIYIYIYIYIYLYKYVFVVETECVRVFISLIYLHHADSRYTDDHPS